MEEQCNDMSHRKLVLTKPRYVCLMAIEEEWDGYVFREFEERKRFTTKLDKYLFKPHRNFF